MEGIRPPLSIRLTSQGEKLLSPPLQEGVPFLDTQFSGGSDSFCRRFMRLMGQNEYCTLSKLSNVFCDGIGAPLFHLILAY